MVMRIQYLAPFPEIRSDSPCSGELLLLPCDRWLAAVSPAGR